MNRCSQLYPLGRGLARRRLPLPTFCAVLLTAVMLSGCGKELSVMRYPDFYRPGLERVAVLPFNNHTGRSGAGDLMAEALADALRENGTYRVVGPDEVERQTGRGGARLGPGESVESIAAKFRRSGIADAVLVGTVTDFDTERYYRYIEPLDYYGPYYHYWGPGYPYWGRPYYGHRARGTHRRHHGHSRGHFHGGYGYYPHSRYYAGYQPYAYPEDLAEVSVRASLVDVSEGRALYATPGAIDVRAYGRGGGSQENRALLNRAVSRAAAKILGEVAAVPVKIRVDPSRVLRTARRRGEDYEQTDDFTPADESFHAIIRLPEEAARNSFRLTVVRAGRSEVLAERTFRWEPGQREQRVRFDLAEITERGGLGRYQLRFHSDAVVVLDRSFKVERD